MIKEYLEAFERGILEFEKELEDDCNNEWLKRVVAGMKKCYQRLEAIDNANPSEALRELEGIEYVADVLKVNHKIGSRDIANQEIKEMVDRLNYRIPTIKQALLKAQEPKHYLKWEDLKFDDEWKCKTVKLNGTKYKIKYKCDFDFFNNYYQDVVIYSDDDRTVFAKLRDKKQFFNDLRLERVEE